MTLAIGSRLGAYEVVALVGRGGMGEVYRARDTVLNRDVAIKVLPDLFAADAERLARFKREAQVLASLNHPHICTLYHIGSAPNPLAGTRDPSHPQSLIPHPQAIQFLVLELVEGTTLADRIAQGPVPLADTLPIARQIAEALEAAHEHGVVHRDLKPANIKVTADGLVKVLDFGLAKALAPAPGSSPSVSQSPTITTPAMTQAGMILGTAAYMSPEQAKGREADKRSDVWAFGCVLYEMLTGARAFDGEDMVDVLGAVARLEPDWSRLPADTPTAIGTLLQGCLTKDRRQRIGDSAAALFVLKAPALGVPAARAVPQPTVPAKPLWRRALPSVASALLASAFVGVAAWQLRPSPPRTVTRFTYRLGDGQFFTNTSRHLVALSPDGTRLAYVANTRLYLKSSQEAEAAPIAGTEGTQVTTPVFSPDGQSIVFYSGSGGTGNTGTLRKIATSGGAAVTLCEASNPYGMSWDGDSILFGQAGKGIVRVSANGGTPEVLAGVKADEVAHGPQMLPGGRALLYTLANGTDWNSAQIVVQALGSSERKTVINGGADARYLSTGHIVYALGGVMLAVPFDAQRLEVVGGAVPVVEGVRRGGTTAVAHLAISGTGSLAYIPGPTTTTSGRYDLARLDRKGSVERLKLPPRAYEFPRVSPDGRQLAVRIDDAKEASVWIYDLKGTSQIRRLTFGGSNTYPMWTADSARVAFQSDRDGDPAIFWQRADGTGTAERLTTPDKGQAHIPHAWSPKGDTLLFAAVNGSNQSLWTFSLPDKKAAPFGAVRSSVASTGAAFSPNGRWVAYNTSDETGRAMVFVQPFPSTGAKYQIADGVSPVWTPDGKELFISPGPNPNFLVVSVSTEPTFTFGSPTTVPRPGYVGTSRHRNYDITPDGHRVVMVVEADDSAGEAERAPHINVVLNWFDELKARVPSGR